MRSIDVFIEANRRQTTDIEIIKVILTLWKQKEHKHPLEIHGCHVPGIDDQFCDDIAIALTLLLSRAEERLNQLELRIDGGGHAACDEEDVKC
jgi:hypothetical protein